MILCMANSEEMYEVLCYVSTKYSKSCQSKKMSVQEKTIQEHDTHKLVRPLVSQLNTHQLNTHQ